MQFTDKQLVAIKEELDRIYVLFNRAVEAKNPIQIKYYKNQITHFENYYKEVTPERTNSL